ncbi:MAG: hypothetical protein KDD53_07380, partial [Bdellovibrionales bacterium]|nr:hypothetical protein [Bdellovibrionales bacterium]
MRATRCYLILGLTLASLGTPFVGHADYAEELLGVKKIHPPVRRAIDQVEHNQDPGGIPGAIAPEGLGEGSNATESDDEGKLGVPSAPIAMEKPKVAVSMEAQVKNRTQETHPKIKLQLSLDAIHADISDVLKKTGVNVNTPEVSKILANFKIAKDVIAKTPNEHFEVPSAAEVEKDFKVNIPGDPSGESSGGDAKVPSDEPSVPNHKKVHYAINDKPISPAVPPIVIPHAPEPSVDVPNDLPDFDPEDIPDGSEIPSAGKEFPEPLPNVPGEEQIPSIPNVEPIPDSTPPDVNDVVQDSLNKINDDIDAVGRVKDKIDDSTASVANLDLDNYGEDIKKKIPSETQSVGKINPSVNTDDIDNSINDTVDDVQKNIQNQVDNIDKKVDQVQNEIKKDYSVGSIDKKVSDSFESTLSLRLDGVRKKVVEATSNAFDGVTGFLADQTAQKKHDYDSYNTFWHRLFHSGTVKAKRK